MKPQSDASVPSVARCSSSLLVIGSLAACAVVLILIGALLAAPGLFVRPPPQQTLLALAGLTVAVALVTQLMLVRRTRAQMRDRARLLQQATDYSLSEDEPQFETKEIELRDLADALASLSDRDRARQHDYEKQSDQLAKDIQDLESRRTELEAANKRARAEFEARVSFFAQMSHEIRTPLNGVIGIAELARQIEAPPAVRNYLDTILESGRSLAQMVSDVLDHANLDLGQLELAKRSFRLDELLRNLLPTVAAAARDKNVRFEAHVDDDVPHLVVGDPDRLRLVLQCLLSNAVKFTDKGGVELWLDTTRQDEQDFLRLHVKDSGIGMTASDMNRVFDAYVQADSGVRRRFGGAGLGLSLSRRLAHLMNGRLEVTSSLGCGSTFTLLVPLEGAQRPNVRPLEGEILLVHQEHGLQNLLRRLQRLGLSVNATCTIPETISSNPGWILISDALWNERRARPAHFEEYLARGRLAVLDTTFLVGSLPPRFGDCPRRCSLIISYDSSRSPTRVAASRSRSPDRSTEPCESCSSKTTR